jgi:CheY-like chemotaxis protein
MLETLSDIFQEKGYRIETAKTGKEAIIKAKKRFFDVALLDIKLPDITGIEVLRTLRKKILP